MVCPNCHQPNPPGARFCNNCGTALEAAAPETGDRRFVTILFADVVGSTAWAERVDPEEWAEIMNKGLRLIIPAVARYEGTVARLMGDGLLALFGAPVAQEDHAERAVLAALAIRSAAADYARELVPHYGTEFAVRVGVNSGLAVVTKVGNETKAEYTPMGDAANLAARLQSLAPPQGVLIGPETYALTKHAFEVRPRGSVDIRGRRESLETYEVLGPLTAADARRPAAAPATPFVGRQAEMAALRDAVQRAREGRPGLVLLVGEAGLGKSRLLAELRAREEGVTWLEGRAISYARTAPYHPWRPPLVSSLGAGEGAADAELTHRLRQLHLAEPAAAAGEPGAQGEPPWLPALVTLLGLEEEEPGSGGPLEAREATRLIAAGVHAHLARLARDEPVVLVLEDIHWADNATVDLLEHLAYLLRDERLLLLCAMRPDRGTRAWQLLSDLTSPANELAAKATVVEVTAFDRTEAAALLDDLLEDAELPPAVRAAILEKSDGNPFYLEEVVHASIDAGRIVREGGRWKATSRMAKVTMPDTLAGVLGARIDQLPERERQVAQTASVFGREFATPLLRAVMIEPTTGQAPDLEPPLDTLTLEGLLNPLDYARFADYRFKHQFTRDAAYHRLLRKRRKELHGRVGEEMEALYGDHREVAKDLAHHYLLGERWFQAARWSLEAGRSARRLYEPRAALELTETALSALERLEAEGAQASMPSVNEAGGEPADEARAALALRTEVLNELLSLGMQMRQHEDPELRPTLTQRGEQAVELSRRLGDPRTLVQSLLNLGNVHVLAGYPRTGFTWLMEAYDRAAELGDDRLFLLPLWVATEIMMDDSPAQAVEKLDEVVEMARRVGNKPIEAHALGSKTAALARLGEFEEALKVGPEALAAAEASDSVIKLADVNLLMGLALLEMGEPRPGIQHLAHGTDLALSVNGFECACNGLHLMGLGHLQEEHVQEALDELARAQEIAAGTAMEHALHNVRAALANAHFLAGDVAALGRIEREIENAEALNDGFGAATGRLALAGALVALGRGAEAVEPLRRVLEWVEERGMWPYVVKGYRLLAQALRAAGDPADSDEAVSRAEQASAHIHFPQGRRGAGFRFPPPAVNPPGPYGAPGSGAE